MGGYVIPKALDSMGQGCPIHSFMTDDYKISLKGDLTAKLLYFSYFSFSLSSLCLSFRLDTFKLKKKDNLKGTRCLGSVKLVFEKRLLPFVLKCI